MLTLVLLNVRNKAILEAKILVAPVAPVLEGMLLQLMVNQQARTFNQLLAVVATHGENARSVLYNHISDEIAPQFSIILQ